MSAEPSARGPSDRQTAGPAGVRLRICYVISYFYPFASGAERQALLQGAELVRRGHSVHVLTHHVPGYPAEWTEQGIHIHRSIRSLRSARAGPFFGLSFVASAARALRTMRGQFDIVHTHQAMWEAVASGLARGWLGGAPTIVQPASSGAYGEGEQLLRTRGSGLLRRMILRNNHFVAISADIERQWLALGVPPERMTRLASGVDTNHFRPGPSAIENRLPPRPRVVFTGRLHPQKNLEVLIEAWRAVVERHRAHLILIGGGEWRDSLRELAKARGVDAFVHFTGTLGDPAEYLRAADAFVLPSVAEGMSNSLLEAMACGLPCLASEIGGNTDLLKEGETGLLVSANNAEAWAAAIGRVLEDRDLAKMIGNRAQERIEYEFALKKVVDRYLKLYGRLLSRQRTL